jgi:general secretion pathway protein I
LRDKSGASGFTLLETLVAMMILAICLVTIMELFSGGLRSGKVTNDYTEAVFHAKSRMEELLLSKTLMPGVWEGSFNDGFSWKATIDDVTTSDMIITPTNKLFIIRVAVRWHESGRNRSFEISTLKIGESIKTGS